ncbi:tetraacyldisaccharide 4'-kinase [Mesonia aquimarina]|uniref:tetraacyldisaccharide 4'-kinase n=1 Tax=Mesonia aquimarina TaxID=1504967 RepID=UPI000EF57D65|nr:tetraacyldisaccharide 4'-kinase [Mesonia aquimarina]
MQLIRKLLFPFSILYGSIVWLRNKFFDWNILTSKVYDFPVICVGNLNVGGTGKSPMIEYLIRLLQDSYNLATLSRGYKRTTSGFYLLKGNESAALTGDEPLQFKQKFPSINVAVHENRQAGIQQLRRLNPQPEVILLDDAFQHRKVKPGFSIVLSAYHDLYVDDFMLPTGNLREPKTGIKRANLVIITKCPIDLNKKQQEKIRKKLNLQDHQQLYFSSILYDESCYSISDVKSLESLNNFTLVTGIANPTPLVNYLEENNLSFKHLAFADHHNFNEQEIAKLNKEEFILTTEKDFVRLKGRISKEKLFYIPIKTCLLNNEDEFKKELLKFIDEY